MGEVAFMPCLVRPAGGDAGGVITLGHPLLDAYIELVTARARWNTVLATAFDLKVFFSVVAKDPADVVTADVLAFIKDSAGHDAAPRWCASKTARRGCLPARSSGGWRRLYEYLIVRGDTGLSRNPVPRGWRCAVPARERCGACR